MLQLNNKVILFISLYKKKIITVGVDFVGEEGSAAL